MEWALSLPEADLIASLAAIGEELGGRFDRKRMCWLKPPPPRLVRALLDWKV